MGFRFQKRVRIFPGVTLNFSKSGVSTSFGGRGARVTLGHGKTRATVGLPGSGLSYTTVSGKKRGGQRASGPAPATTPIRWRRLFWIALAIFLFAMLRPMFS